jgi:phosphatidylserine/phosphatidylglycerophosphate/cardiolipin synthase-like enzyme
MENKFRFYTLVCIGLICILPVHIGDLGAAFAMADSPQIQAYFTPGTDCEDNIISRLTSAQSADIAVYAITNRRIVDAIFAAQARGATIRIITDRLQSAGRGSLAKELAAAGLPVRKNRGPHKIMHNKFAVFDGRTVVSGSYNWTASASAKNAENCMFFAQPAGRPFSAQFQYLWDLYGDAQ